MADQDSSVLPGLRRDRAGQGIDAAFAGCEAAARGPGGIAGILGSRIP